MLPDDPAVSPRAKIEWPIAQMASRSVASLISSLPRYSQIVLWVLRRSKLFPLSAIRTESECRPSRIESGFNASIHSSIEGHLYSQFPSISAIAQPLIRCTRWLGFRADLVVGANHARGSSGAAGLTGLPEGWKNVVRPSRPPSATPLRTRRSSSSRSTHRTRCTAFVPNLGAALGKPSAPRVPCSPCFIRSRSGFAYSHSLLSHPLRGARCREDIIGLWQ